VGQPAKVSESATGAEAVRRISAYVELKNPKLELVANAVRQLVKKTVPEAREAVNTWGLPTFEQHGPMCYMIVGKNHVTLGFTRGTSLEDSAELLEGKGKNLRHVKVKEVE